MVRQGLCLGLLLVLGACAPGVEVPAGASPEVAQDELRLARAEVRVVGSMRAGESPVVAYTRTPRFRAVSFQAAGGSVVDVTVSGVRLDAVAWLADERFDVHAFNDDADAGTRDAALHLTLPGDAAVKTWYVILREYWGRSGSFTVGLRVAPPRSLCPHGPSYFDGCNTCACEPSTGLTRCTRRACVATCFSGGRSYRSGQTFPASDGCNTCTCLASGRVACTLRACLCSPRDPDRTYTSRDPEVCARVRFACPQGQVAFSDRCGCGCEPAAVP
jgi:hypothetical protein